ncbi:hypothetical protein NVP1121O_253 [Vibrio phage 1.121.O._10N.286.46.C4]|nr:hypothetical protein NVP1121O_253 [Vibrio phage 1.121.O._10N.286.46.C4]
MKVGIIGLTKMNTITNTIWRQELKSTTDYVVLTWLHHAYNLVTEEVFSYNEGAEIDYEELYNKVLNKFEEIS